MSRYIEADALAQQVCVKLCTASNCSNVLKIIHDIPTTDVVEVVRCKDCDWFIVNELKADGTTDKRYKPTWCTYHNGYMNDDDFCSYGERREE